MSASREKKSRQELAESGWMDPKVEKEAAAKKAVKKNNTLYAILGVVFAVIIAVALLWQSNIIGKRATALTIDGTEYAAPEVSFYYHNAYLNFMNSFSNVVSFMGLDPSAPLESQLVNDTARQVLGLTDIQYGTTWHDLILGMANDQMAVVQKTLEAADAEGYVYPANLEEQVALNTAAVSDAAGASGYTMEEYLQQLFGPMATVELYEQETLRLLKYSDYITSVEESLTYSDEDVKAIYEANRDTYDTVSYEYVSILASASISTDDEGNIVSASEEETNAAHAEAEAFAAECEKAFAAGKDMREVVSGVEIATYWTQPASYYDEISNSTISAWLFSEQRQSGDVTVLDAGNVIYVVRFLDRSRDDTSTVAIRHILVALEDGEIAIGEDGYDEEQVQLAANAYARAEEILNEWKNGEATEASFGEFAAQYSADGNAYQGGIYTGVYPGKMVETFNDWCFDPARQVGDTGIVETPFGAHVMYFSAHESPVWRAQVETSLRQADLDAWSESLIVDCVIETHDFGMKFMA